MNAIHINWTAPYRLKTDVPYSAEDFELLTTILSALKWREKNGSIKMITDSVGMEYYEKNRLTRIWDGVECALDDIDVNAKVFWAAGKIFALRSQSAPVVMLDTDFIVWESIDWDKISGTAAIHFEDLYPDVYPGKEYFKMRGYEFDADFDWSLRACNTALCLIKDERLLRYYTEQSIEFMRHADEEEDTLKYMVFAEQRLLPMCAKKLGVEITAFSSLDRLFRDGEGCFTHTWGMKQQMRDNDALRYDFCRRCINRIVHEYPYMYTVMRDIDCLKRYF